MAGREAEYRVRAPVARQDWRTMTFIHWAYEPDVVQALLPGDLAVHVRDGRAWVSLTPFVLVPFRLGSGPSHAWPAFPETNLRTYATADDGRDGIWFLDIEAASAVTVHALRTTLALPYHVSQMSVDERAPFRYSSVRRVGEAVMHELTVEVGDEIPDDGPDSLDHWLAGRWRAYAAVAGRRVAVPVEHQPWRLHEAVLTAGAQTLLAAAGLPPPQEPPLVRYSPGVSVRIGVPRPIRAGRGRR